MKLDPNYYKPGSHHKCMFCSTIIGRLLDSGQIASLGNKVHVLLEKQNPGLYTINGCAACVREIDWSNQKVLDAIHANVVAVKENNLQQLQVSQKKIDEQKKLWNRDKPKVGWHVIEMNPVEREKNVAAYIDYFKQKEQR